MHSEHDQAVLNFIEKERKRREERLEATRPEVIGRYLPWWRRLFGNSSYCHQCSWSALYIYQTPWDRIVVCPKCHAIRQAELWDEASNRNRRTTIEPEKILVS